MNDVLTEKVTLPDGRQVKVKIEVLYDPTTGLEDVDVIKGWWVVDGVDEKMHELDWDIEIPDPASDDGRMTDIYCFVVDKALDQWDGRST